MPRTRSHQQKRHYLVHFAAFVAAAFFVATTCTAQAKPGAPTAQQSKNSVVAQDVSAFPPELVPEFGQLLVKLEKNVQFPGPRSQSRLLPLLPESTIFFASFPNYGDAAHQALQIFRQELQESPVLLEWWQGGENTTKRAKFEDSIEKFCLLHQYLGEEIVVSGSMKGQEPTFLAFAEIRKLGLKKFLEEIAAKSGGESGTGVRVLDPQTLVLEKEKSPKQPLLVLVRNDFVIAAENPVLLRAFSARLDHHGQEFLSNPFGHRWRGNIKAASRSWRQRISRESWRNPHLPSSRTLRFSAAASQT